MTDHIDRGLRQTIDEVVDIHNDIRGCISKNAACDDISAAILTLATVTHHQNGMKP